MLKILISGFEPFNGSSLNPSAELIKDLSWAKDFKPEAVLLPVEFEAAWQSLRSAIDRSRPDLVLMLGQAGGRASVEIERVAINCMQRRHADTGARDSQTSLWKSERISESGPDALFSTLPMETLAQAVLDHGHQCHISNSAGTYVCNYVFYQVLEKLRFTPARAGFIHLPYLPEQVAELEKTCPSAPRAQQAAVLNLILRSVLL